MVISLVYSKCLNPLLHRLFLEHDIIFYIKTTLKKFKKNLRLFLNTFENMENGAFAANAPFSIILIFSNM